MKFQEFIQEKLYDEHTQNMTKTMNESMGGCDYICRDYNNRFSMFTNTHMDKVDDGIYVCRGSLFKNSVDVCNKWWNTRDPQKSIDVWSDKMRLRLFNNIGEQMFWACCQLPYEIYVKVDDFVKDDDFVIFISKELYDTFKDPDDNKICIMTPPAGI